MIKEREESLWKLHKSLRTKDSKSGLNKKKKNIAAVAVKRVEKTRGSTTRKIKMTKIDKICEEHREENKKAKSNQDKNDSKNDDVDNNNSAEEQTLQEALVACLCQ